ncbi:MAG: S49 family peptidase [Parvularculales bacterium]
MRKEAKNTILTSMVNFSLNPVKWWREKCSCKRVPVVSVVRLSGVIGASGGVRGLSNALDIASVADSLERAFSVRHVKAVAVIINSPGGSPVQSAMIYRRIRALSEEKDVPVFAFAEDVAASGGYMLACAGDEIYADESSVIGSVGVISAGFGFTALLEKLGVERRIHATGPNKGMLDPFQPEDPAHVGRLTAIQGDIYEVFTTLVCERRGKRLKSEDDDLFSGAFWAGRRALALGLIDGIGDMREVMREKYGEKVRFLVVNRARSWRQRLGLTLGTAFGDELLTSLEASRLWSRFGIWR